MRTLDAARADAQGGRMGDPKAAQAARRFQPEHERRAITDDEIRGLRVKWDQDGDGFAVRMADRALAGDVSAVNACKAAIHGLE